MPSAMPETPQIFKVRLTHLPITFTHHLPRVVQATYSGIPVYEL